MIGATLGHHRILSPLGQGGMGQVYRARDERLGREVALKVLPPGLAVDDEFRRRFEREARIIASLRHPNIVTVYSVEADHETPYITMELVEGLTLSELISEGGLPRDQFLALATPLVDAVAAAHAQGVVHRDLKPANVMVEDGTVKVLDFGLAKMGDADPALTQAVTQPGTLLGTAAYMSPEQASGKPVDHRSDLFSLGVVLYEMATGVCPFARTNYPATLYAIVHDAPPPVADVRGDLPPQLDTVLGRALAKQPAGRYPTALQLLDALRELAGSGVSSPALPDSDLRRKRPRLVVFAFENLGEPDDAYFASGLAEELATRLAVVKSLVLTSRNTAVQYDRTGKTMSRIATDLGVDYVLDGSIRWARRGQTSRVRVSVQLVDAARDEQVWAGRHDRDLEDIFDVQAEIAEDVARGLDVTLQDSELAAMDHRVTDNVEAYQAYLRGLDYMTRLDWLAEDYRLAIQMFERALELDPEFVAAQAWIAQAHARLFHHGRDRTSARVELADAAARRALTLDPASPHAHHAMGLVYYTCYRDNKRALESFAVATQGLPGDRELALSFAASYRRSGQFEEALTRFQRLHEDDPRDATTLLELGSTHAYLGEYEQAEKIFRNLIAMAPDAQWVYSHLSMILVSGKGDLVGARRAVDAMPRSSVDNTPPQSYLLALNEQDWDRALRDLENLPEIYEDQEEYLPRSLLRGEVEWCRGDRDRARTLFLDAAATIERHAETEPLDDRAPSALGRAYAGLGRDEEAIRLGERGLELCPIAKDSIVGAIRLFDLVLILCRVGEVEAARARYDQLMSLPTYQGPFSARLDPRLAALVDGDTP